MTSRSNQKCTPVMGETCRRRTFANTGSWSTTCAGSQLQRRLMRDRQHVDIGRFFAAGHPSRWPARGRRTRAGRAQAPAAALRRHGARWPRRSRRRARRVECCGIPRQIAGAIREKCLPENVQAIARVQARKLFVERADQHHTPEARDRAPDSVRAGAASRACSRRFRRRPALSRRGARWPSWHGQSSADRPSSGTDTKPARAPGATAPAAARLAGPRDGPPNPRRAAGRSTQSSAPAPTRR